jgi:glutathione S-transferase
MLKLYNAAHSTCSQKVRICLFEKNLSFEDILLDIGKAQEHLQPQYLKLNPNGVVPTLVDSVDVITDSSVICEYLEEKFPDNPLTPENIVQRAKMRAWMRFIEEVPTSAVRYPSFNMGFLPRYEGLNVDQFKNTFADIRPIRKHFYLRMGPSGFKNEEIEASLEQIKKTCLRMDKALEDGPWLLGKQLTLADVIVCPLIDRMKDLGFDDIWNSEFPRVQDWYERFQLRDSFKKTFYPKSRMSEFLNLTSAFKN